jgi:hypothetical protein
VVVNITEDEKGTPVKIRDCTRSCNPGPKGLRQS